MLNNKNTARCLEYFDKSFKNTFISSLKSNETVENFDLGHQVKLLMVQTMFSVIFGSELENFFATEKRISLSNLEQTHLVANKFTEAFVDFESFSLLKFLTMMTPELKLIWISLNNFKRFFNTYIFTLSYFSDPMDWFYKNFIIKNLSIYKNMNSYRDFSKREMSNSIEDFNVEDLKRTGQSFFSNSPNRTVRGKTNLQMQIQNKKNFCFFDSFIFLTKNPIIKYNSDFQNRKMSSLKPMPSGIKKAFTKTKNLSCSSYSQLTNNKEGMMKNRERRRSFNVPLNNLNVDVSENFWIDKENMNSQLNLTRGKLNSSSFMPANDLKLEDDFENWKLTLNEALSNTLLMFFAGNLKKN